MGEDDTKPMTGRLDPLHADAGLDLNADAFALGLQPRDAISTLMRLIDSDIGTALFTRTIPSSLSARAPVAAADSKRNNSEVAKLARRNVL
jgi:hypothetical protein